MAKLVGDVSKNELVKIRREVVAFLQENMEGEKFHVILEPPRIIEVSVRSTMMDKFRECLKSFLTDDRVEIYVGNDGLDELVEQVCVIERSHKKN